MLKRGVVSILMLIGVSAVAYAESHVHYQPKEPNPGHTWPFDWDCEDDLGWEYGNSACTVHCLTDFVDCDDFWDPTDGGGASSGGGSSS